jgi:hypothetical protein
MQRTIAPVRIGLCATAFGVGVMTFGAAGCGEEKCFLDCVPVPPGCHVEGANGSTDCSKASCGTIVCPASDAGDAGESDAGSG